MQNKPRLFNNLHLLPQGVAIAACWLLMAPAQGAPASAEPDAARIRREAAEISENQVEAARGYAEFVAAMKNSPPGTPPSAHARMISAGQSKVFGTINQRRKEENERIFDKVYNLDGKVLGKATTWKESPESVASGPDRDDDDDTPSPSPSRKVIGTTSTSGAPMPSTSSRTKRTPAQNSGPGKTKWVLDGSEVPKELSFPGASKTK